MQPTHEYDSQTWNVTVVRNRKGTRSKFAQQMEVHYTNPSWKEEIDRISEGVRERIPKEGPNPIVLPKWLPRSGMKERKLLKEQAAALGWVQDLEWVLHSFRNGAACDAFLRHADEGVLKALVAVQKRTGHISLEMLRHYAVSNEDRLKYQKMKMDEGLLRMGGVVADSVESQVRPLFVGNGKGATRTKVSAMHNVGDSEEWKEYMRQVSKKKKKNN